MLTKSINIECKVGTLLVFLLFMGADSQSVFAQGPTPTVLKHGQSSDYSEAMAKLIRRNLFPPMTPVGRPAIFEVSISRSGALLRWKKIQSCGLSSVDYCAELAITKSAPFPAYGNDRSSPVKRHFLVTIDPFQSLNLPQTVLVTEKK